MAERIRIYLAGPEVFLRDAVEVGRRKKALCEALGFEGLFPFDNEIAAEDRGPGVDRIIYRANVDMMLRAHCAVFNLSPFRGPGSDVGTAFELGYVTAIGKPAFGYTNVAHDYIDGVRRHVRVAYDAATASWRDEDDISIEDFGNADNLMLDNALREGGHPVVRRDSAVPGDLADLAGFEACLGMVRAAFAG